jgi:hypothetical protein
LLACISLFLFTKSKGRKTKQKIIRNRIYRIAGIIILVSISLIAVYHFGDYGTTNTNLKPIFWLETIALFAFGSSWLIKGEIILKDKD